MSRRRIYEHRVSPDLWCIGDLMADYRICTYHHERKGGYAHVHHPQVGKGTVRGHLNVESFHAARALVRRYAQKHKHFDMELLRKESLR